MDYTVENVRDPKYGALGDGNRDDTSAITKALRTVEASGGGIVYLPQGAYKISGVLAIGSNTIVRGAGPGTVIFNGNPSNVTMLQINGNHTAVEELVIRYDTPQVGIGIFWAANTLHTRISKCTFTGATAQAVYLDRPGIEHVSVTDCRFDGVLYGILTNLNANDLSDLRINNNHFVNISGDAIEINSPIQMMGVNREPFDAAYNISIHGNYISCPPEQSSSVNAGFGIGIAGGTYISITGNVIANCRQQGIHIEDNASHINITGNTIHDIGSSPDLGTNSGIYVIHSDYLTISSNTIRKCGDYGIQLDFSMGEQVNEVVLTSNLITECSTGGIRITGDTYSDFHVADNIVNRNGGSGLSIAGQPIGLKVLDNTFRNNAAYGIQLVNGGFLSEFSGNSLYSNALGPVFFETAPPRIPVPMRDQNNYVTAVVSGSYTPWVDALSLGKAAEGLLYLVAKQGPLSKTDLYRVVWNGTALTITKIRQDYIGAIDLVTPKMRGSFLQVQAYRPSSTGTTVEFSVQFFGTILIG
ncbi:right-handed parallel beta-helix repeat-containing protein [Paenibacillus sp. S-38]|uniref:right-handed parallel beta-helix repeat-containing protein n=1 Tax=Paenibacillus sp. S-38 TaxID=3416710 RepID=UPI003CF65B95